MDIKKIEINLNRGCNFDCSYCYETDKKNKDLVMSQSTLDQTIKMIKSFYNNLKCNQRLQISIYGGESLYKPELIDYLIHNLDGYNITYCFVTNGSLIRKNFRYILTWRLLTNNEIAFSISYDYCLQNQNRNNNTEQLIKDNIKLLNRFNIKFSTNSVIPLNDIERIPDVYQNYIQLSNEINNHYSFKLQFDRNIQIKDLDQVSNSLGKVKQRLDQLDKQYLTSKYGIECFNQRYNNCGFYYRVLCGIDYDGKIYPCQGSIFKTDIDLSYGTVYDDFEQLMIKREQFHKKYVWNKDKMNKCNSCNLVCNYCPLQMLNKYNDVFEIMPDETTCEFRKLITMNIFR